MSIGLEKKSQFVHDISCTQTFSVAATEIPDSDLLWHSDDATQTAKSKNGILEQLGRMIAQDHYNEYDCVYIANLAIAALKNGKTSREIEKAIQNVRTANKRVAADPDSELAQLGGTLMIFKQGMIEFDHKLHESKRTPEGYAETFAKYFVDTDALLPDKASWMQLTNTTMQYVSSVMPEKETPQLVKRMHYVSFMGMFRFDLFEGLCVGHAPGDKRGRTCRQIGNLKGREQRELADDHPIKAVYKDQTYL